MIRELSFSTGRVGRLFLGVVKGWDQFLHWTKSGTREEGKVGGQDFFNSSQFFFLNWRTATKNIRPPAGKN